MQKYGSFLFVGIFVVFMFFARMSETLVCEAKNETTIFCDRIQDRIFHESHRKYVVSDFNSIDIQKRKIGRKHYIRAISETGKKVVLLSVPEKHYDYAKEIVEQLKTLPQSETKKLEYTRNEMHSQLLLLSVAGLVALVCIVLLVRKKKK